LYSLGHSLLPADQIFHVAELSAEVDPSKANVTFKDGVLEIVMPIVPLANGSLTQANLKSSAANHTSDVTATASPDTTVKETGDKAKAASSIG
jgi:hypothetical protein